MAATLRAARITGTGSFLPERVVTNAELSTTLDTVGPLCRTVEDCALIYGALVFAAAFGAALAALAFLGAADFAAVVFFGAVAMLFFLAFKSA